MTDNDFESLRKRVSDKLDANRKQLDQALEKRLPGQHTQSAPTPAFPTQTGMQMASAQFAPDSAETQPDTPTPSGAGTTPKTGRPAAPTGTWRCIVNSSIVSIDLTANINADSSLVGKGTIIYLGTSKVVNVHGPGDWTALAPDSTSPEWLFKFRMQPSNHALFSWYASPTDSPNHLRNRFVAPNQSGIVETTCERIS